jgi:hypothetical protein
MRMTLPARESTLWARSASSVTWFQVDASPAVRKIDPSEANFTLPTEWPYHSLGMLSRIVVSEAADAVSPETVRRVSRLILRPA